MSEQVSWWCSWLFLHACNLMVTWGLLRVQTAYRYSRQNTGESKWGHRQAHASGFIRTLNAFLETPPRPPSGLSLRSPQPELGHMTTLAAKNPGKSEVRTDRLAWTITTTVRGWSSCHSELNAESVGKNGAGYRHWVGNYLSLFWVSILRISKSSNK